MRKAHVITIGHTDTNKTLDSLAQVWKELGDNGATRHSCLINLGGVHASDQDTASVSSLPMLMLHDNFNRWSTPHVSIGTLQRASPMGPSLDWAPRLESALRNLGHEVRWDSKKSLLISG